MKHYLLLFIFALLLCNVAASQTATYSQEKPAWVDGYFREVNNSYIEAVSATGPTEDEARNKAAAVAVERRSLSTGKRVQVQVQNGTVSVKGNDELTVKSRILDEYRERLGPGEYRVHLLTQTAKNPTYEFERVNVTAEYGFSPSAFVPGLMQLHKGQKGKGGVIIAAEVAFIGGIIITESLRASYESKINTTHNANDKQTYIDNADNMANMRNIMIGGAVAVYAYSVIDALATKGKKHVVVLGSAGLRFAPYATPQSGGIALSLNF
jgi:hypothetical protein